MISSKSCIRTIARCSLLSVLVWMSVSVSAAPVVSTDIYTDRWAEDVNGNILISTGTVQTVDTDDSVSGAPFTVFDETWTISSDQFDDVFDSLWVDIYTDFNVSSGDTNSYEVDLFYSFSSSSTATDDAIADVNISWESFTGVSTLSFGPGNTGSLGWLYELYGEAQFFGPVGEYSVTATAKLDITDIRTVATNVSEPSSLAIMLLGLAGLFARARR